MRQIIVIFFTMYITLCCAMVSADAESGFRWDVPTWVNPAAGFSGSVFISDAREMPEIRCRYQFPGAEAVAVACNKDDQEAGLFSFQVPAREFAGLGEVAVYVEALDGDRVVTSSSRKIPISYYLEIDITGPAAVPLLHPLPDPSAQVRYIPCCNIYGGLLIAARIPVNPTENRVGLPDELGSDFFVLEPDGLTASTMGLYFEFTYDPAPKETKDHIGLYEWTGLDWREVASYQVDAAKGQITFHCPDGGTFVMGRK